MFVIKGTRGDLMSKKSIGLLVCTILIFLLIASAMAIENKSADENFTSPDLNIKSIKSEAPDLSAPADTGEKAYFGNMVSNLGWAS